MIGARITTNADSLAGHFQAIRSEVRTRTVSNIARLQGKRMVEIARQNLKESRHIRSGALMESIGSGVVLKGALGGYLITTGPRANFKKTWANQNQTYFTRSARNAKRARARGIASVITGEGRVKHPIQYAMWIERGVRQQRRSKIVKGKKQTRQFTQYLSGGPSHFMANVFAQQHVEELGKTMADKVNESIKANVKP